MKGPKPFDYFGSEKLPFTTVVLEAFPVVVALLRTALAGKPVTVSVLLFTDAFAVLVSLTWPVRTVDVTSPHFTPQPDTVFSRVTTEPTEPVALNVPSAAFANAPA